MVCSWASQLDPGLVQLADRCHQLPAIDSDCVALPLGQLSRTISTPQRAWRNVALVCCRPALEWEQPKAPIHNRVAGSSNLSKCTQWFIIGQLDLGVFRPRLARLCGFELC